VFVSAAISVVEVEARIAQTDRRDRKSPWATHSHPAAVPPMNPPIMAAGHANAVTNEATTNAPTYTHNMAVEMTNDVFIPHRYVNRVANVMAILE